MHKDKTCVSTTQVVKYKKMHKDKTCSGGKYKRTHKEKTVKVESTREHIKTRLSRWKVQENT